MHQNMLLNGIVFLFFFKNKIMNESIFKLVYIVIEFKLFSRQS